MKTPNTIIEDLKIFFSKIDKQNFIKYIDVSLDTADSSKRVDIILKGDCGGALITFNDYKDISIKTSSVKNEIFEKMINENIENIQKIVFEEFVVSINQKTLKVIELKKLLDNFNDNDTLFIEYGGNTRDIRTESVVSMVSDMGCIKLNINVEEF